MQVFILRHAEAERVAPTDRDRALTARGEQDLREVLSRSQRELTPITHLFVSPYVRARQTADIAMAYLPSSTIRETTDRLVPEADPAQLVDFLEHLRGEQGIQAALLVGHQPLLGVFFDRLCGFEVGRYRLSTAGLAAVEADPVAAGLGDLQWLRQPGDRV